MDLPVPPASNNESPENRLTSAPHEPAWRHWGAVLLGIAFVTLLRYSLTPFIGKRVSYTLYLLAVIIVCRFGRLRQGFVAVAISAVLGYALFARVEHGFGQALPDWLNLGIFLVTGSSIVLLNDRQDRLRRRAIAGEAAARRQQTLVMTIATHAADALFLIDPDGLITYANAAAGTLLGRSPDEMQGLNLHELIRCGDSQGNPVDIDRCRINQGIETGETVRGVELTVRHRDGRPIAVECTLARIEQEGARMGSVVTLHDLTHRKRAEQARIESELRFRALIENSDIVVSVVDEGGVVRYVSPAVERITGYTAAEFSTLELSDALLPAEIGRIAEAFVRARENPGRGFVVSYSFRHKDGRRRCFEAIFRDMSADPIIGGIVVNFHDITERTEAEVALRQSREQMAAVTEAAMDAIVGVDEEGCIVTFNGAAERMFRCPAHEALGRPVGAFIPDFARWMDDPELHGPVLDAPSCRRFAHLQTATAITSGGVAVPVETSVSRVEVSGRRICIAVVRDISERLSLEARLLQSQKMESIGRLAGGVAHDFNNLLTVIGGYTELASDSVAADSEVHAYLAYVQKASRRAADLTNQLLGFARKQVFVPRPLGLNEVVMEACSLLARLIDEDVIITRKLDERLWPVMADPGQIQQILVNLAVNARDAMPRGGQISIETANVLLNAVEAASLGAPGAGDYVSFSLSDTGVGMNEETLAHAFEPFFTTKEVGKGTGLGLATCHGIAKQNGGCITLRSDPGKGTTVSVYLPRHRGEGRVEPDPDPADSPGGAETILLVEDEAMVRDLAAAALRSAGYHVLEAEGPLAALAIAADRHAGIDLMVTDVVMPDMDGRELAERLHVSRPSLKVVFASGYAGDQVFRRALADAGAPFLQKPYTARSLTALVRETLDAGT